MERIARCTVAAALVILTAGACQDSVAPPSMKPAPAQLPSAAAEDPGALSLHVVRPRDTDPAIDWAPALVNPEDAYHYVWLDPSVESNDKLLVFMPGTNNRPRDYQLVEKEAARLGYHVIGLMYQNNVGVDAACRGSSDENCSGKMRLEILTGEDASHLIAVTPANSIDNRLAKLLKYLAEQYPDEGWSKFLDDDAPRWKRIAVAGQSQGAGQAALIGKLRHVNRVVMLSGPPDARVSSEVDRWVSIGETPASKYFALYHLRDQLAPGIRANLAALDMEKFGDPALVTGAEGESAYGGAHILTTDLEPQGGYTNPNPHRSTARDAFTPLPAGCTQVGPGCAPLLVDAWRYLLGEPPQEDDE
jgi:hypothetical protein